MRKICYYVNEQYELKKVVISLDERRTYINETPFKVDFIWVKDIDDKKMRQLKEQGYYSKYVYTYEDFDKNADRFSNLESYLIDDLNIYY